MKLFVVFILSSLAFGFDKVGLDGALTDCFKQPLMDPALEQLSWVSLGLNKALGYHGYIDSSKAINEWEKKVLKKHPSLALALPGVRCRSIALAYSICGLDPDVKISQSRMQEEESDAI